jgi:hypothetical protein
MYSSLTGTRKVQDHGQELQSTMMLLTTLLPLFFVFSTVFLVLHLLQNLQFKQLPVETPKKTQ